MTAKRSVRPGISGIALLCTAFSLMVLMHNAATPIFEAPDEVWHYAYVRWIAEGHGLPPLDSDESGASQQAAQPPLYYLVAALVSYGFPDDNLDALMQHNPGFGYQASGTSVDNKNMLLHGSEESWPWHGATLAVHATRLTSLVFGLMTVLATYGLALETTRSRRWALVTAALVAFQPQFVFICSVVSNDSSAAALSTTALWLAARLLRRGMWPGGVALAGCVAGAAALSKTSALLVAPTLGIIVVIASTSLPETPARAPRRARLAAIGVYLVAAAAVGGWWYMRNVLQFGTPLGLARHVDTPWGRAQAAAFAQILSELPTVARTFWAAYGWGHITWPNAVYIILWIATLPLLALAIYRVARLWTAAWCVPSRRRALLRPGNLGDAAPLSGLCCLLWLCAMTVALLRWMQQVEAPHGRLLFPALGAWALLTGLGLRELASISARAGRAWRISLLGLCASLTILAPGARLIVTFTRPRLQPEERVTAQCDHAVDLRYADQAQLLCAEVQSDRVSVGGRVSVRACWTALTPMNTDYTVFAHLIGPDSARVGERHTYPGLGRYPTSDWPVGEAFCDTYVIEAEDWAPAPLRYQLELGLYDAETGERLIAHTANSQPFDPPTVGAITLTPQSTSSETPEYGAAVAFGDGISLVGYDRPDSAIAGESIPISLLWEATGSPGRDYVAFVHLWRPGDSVPLAQHDSQPRDGWYPTSVWAEGDRVPDEHTLEIPETLPPGSYPLWVGLYSPEDGVRLAAEVDVGRLPDDLVPLGQIEIVERAQ